MPIRTTIGEVAKVFDGPHATPRKTQDGPIFLGISSLNRGRLDASTFEHLSEADFQRWTRRVRPEPGDIVFSYETRIGQAAMIPRDLRCCLGRRMGLLRPKRSAVEPRILLHAFLGEDFQETLRVHTVAGSTVDRILLTELPRFPIVLPTREEQLRLAPLLNALQERVELAERMTATLVELERTLFRAWTS